MPINSLLSFQYFNNEKYELEKYDSSLKKYEEASLKTASSLAVLNFGQHAIFSGGLSIIMIMAANQIAQGKAREIIKYAGDKACSNMLLSMKKKTPHNYLRSEVHTSIKSNVIYSN